MKKAKTSRRISFLWYLNLEQVSLIVLCILLLGIFTYWETANLIDQEMGRRITSIVLAGTILIDGDRLAELNTGDEIKPYYQATFKALLRLRNYSGATYIYTMRKSNQKLAYIIDADPTSERNSINAEYTGLDREMEEAFEGKTAVTPHPTFDTDVKIWSRSGYAPIKDSTGKVIAIIGVDISAEQIQKEKKALLLKIIALGFCVAVLSMVYALFSSRRLMKPLRATIHQLNEIATSSSDLTKRLPLKTFLREIAELSEAVNRVQDNALRTFQAVSGMCRQLNSISEKLVTSSQTVSASSEEVAAMMTEIHSGAITQSTNSGNIFQAMESIARASTSVATAATSSEQISLNSVQAAEEGQASIQETLQLLIQVRHYAEKLNDLGIQLNEHSDQIQRMLDLLTSIASQTRILSLNANIEAARAGESGRGFAVVAQQIRILADNSQQSVDQIAERVNGVQTALAANTDLVRGFYDLAQTSGALITNAEQQIVDIREKAIETLTFSKQMSVLTQDQTAQTEETSAIAHEIAKISQQFADSSRVVTMALDEQTQAMQNILEVSQAIHEVTAELQKMILQYKM